MKRSILFLFIVLSLALTACGSILSTNDPASTNQGSPTAGELPATTQLILGTLKLEETENAVTAEQAAELLTLWQTLQVLSESDTAAQQETEALITQIQETMTGEQMQAITDMDLSREDMMTVMQEQGLGMGVNPQNSTSQSGSSSSGGGFTGPAGGMPPPDERGFQGGGPGMVAGGQGQTLSADQIATAQAARQAGGGNMIPAPLLNALIEFLKEKAGS